MLFRVGYALVLIAAGMATVSVLAALVFVALTVGLTAFAWVTK